MSLSVSSTQPVLDRRPARGIDIEVAGLRCLVESTSPELLRLIESRCSWLFQGGAGEPDLTIRYTVGEHRRRAAIRGADTPFDVRRSGAKTLLADDTFTAEIDLANRSVSAHGLLSLAGIDTVIRVVLPELVDDSLLLHSCVLGRNGRAWVCSGPSGAGKSTLLSLLPDLAVGDELALLTRRADAVQVRPLWATGAVRDPLEVEGIFLLEHGDEHERRPIRGSEGLRRLAKETGWPVLSRVAAERSFSVLSWIVGNVPVWNLRFSQDAGVLDVLSG